MQLIDLSHDPALPVLVQLLRDLTRADTSSSALSTFMGKFGEVRPVRHFVGVVEEPRRPGAYRVLYDVAVGPGAGEPAPHVRDMSPAGLRKLPLHEGGLIAKLIGDHQPKFVTGLNVTDDPALGNALKGMRSCLVLPIFGGDEVLEWSLAFGDLLESQGVVSISQALMTANLLGLANRNLDGLREVRRLNAKMSEQLEQIARLQQSLLPSQLPAIPGFEVATSYLSSDQAGGDYYDFFELPDGKWGILIADVSGHGAAAATVTAMLHAIMHSFGALKAGSIDGPAEVMRFANTRLVAGTLDGSFVTAFYGILDPVTGALTYASCGHNPPRVRRLDGSVCGIDDARSIPLGIDDPIVIEHGVTQFAPGDTLVLYTDGISEVFSPQGEMFGVPKLDEAIAGSNGLPQDVIDSIYRALFAHRGSSTRDDDQTMVVVRRMGAM